MDSKGASVWEHREASRGSALPVVPDSVLTSLDSMVFIDKMEISKLGSILTY
jgi:hypothetical protein